MSMAMEMEHDGVKFLISEKQSKAIEKLLESNAGGFATVHGYVSRSGRVTPEVSDMSFISRFSTSRMYDRKIKALEGMQVEDIADAVKNDPKLSALIEADLSKAFDERKAKEIASMNQTLSGDRTGAHREAHARNYHVFGNGVKVHFITEKVDGIMKPVLFNGLPMVESIMINAIVVSKKVITPGEYKKVNSGAPVLISNAIKAKLPRSTKMITLSLKEDNFDSLSLGSVEYLPEDIAGLFT